MWGLFVYREIVTPGTARLRQCVLGCERRPHAPPDEPDLAARNAVDLPVLRARTAELLSQSNASPLNPTPQEQATFDGAHESMRGGWTGTMDQLAAYLAETHVR